jgi:4-hydroxy-tetrahydrodipicolinate synthase
VIGKDVLATAVVVPVTPFDAAGQVDLGAHTALLHHLVSAGITVVTLNGNTGEFYALTAAEARLLVESTVAAVAGRAEVLVGVGQDIATAIGAAQHASSAGARMVMVHQPVHPYVSAEGWVAYHRAIADAVPDLGVVLYIRDERIGGDQIRALGEVSSNVIAVKYAVRDTARFAAVARDAGLDRFTWLAGHAELAAPGYFAVGAAGFTSGLANVAPEASLGLLGALRDGDFAAAMKIWESVRLFEELRAADSSADNVSVVKEALAQLGRCRRDVRPPSRLLPAAIREQITAILASWGRTPADWGLAARAPADRGLAARRPS